jgi:hypothetical protein
VVLAVAVECLVMGRVERLIKVMPVETVEQVLLVQDLLVEVGELQALESVEQTLLREMVETAFPQTSLDQQ